MSLSKAKKWYAQIQYNASLKAILWKHFDRFLPKTSKRILLVDFAKAGGIFLVEDLIKEYLMEKRPQAKVETVAFGKLGNRERSFPDLPEKNWISLHDGPPYLYDALSDHDYEGLAERESFPPPTKLEYEVPELSEGRKDVTYEVHNFLRKSGECEKL